MTINVIISIWLLSLAGSSTVTSGQNHSFNRLTTQDTSSSSPSEVPRLNTPSTTAHGNPAEEKTTTKLPLQTGHTAATPTSSLLSQVNSSTGVMSTEVQSKVTGSTTVSQATNSTKPTTVPLMLTNSTQSQSTGMTPTSQFRDGSTRPSTTPPQSTNLISTAPTSTKPEKDPSASTSPAPGGDATQTTGITSVTKTIPTTKPKKVEDLSGKQTDSKEGANHSKVVAGLIGGALVLMMVGFLVIYMKKRKIQQQQLTTTDWAGPSPFLEGGGDKEQVTLRSSNRISLSSFLPQRLSKRLTLLPETEEELQDMTPGTTFGGTHQGSTFGREVDGNDGQESNGTAAAVPEMKSTGDAAETTENSSQTNNPLTTSNNSEGENVSPSHSENPSDPAGAGEDPPPQINNDLGQP